MSHPGGAPFALGIVAGCGKSDRPDLADVRGAVTLAGASLAGAVVVFEQPGGRASTGRTDAQGAYELTYLRNIKGARLGEHSVKIFTATEDNPEERIPEQYNSSTKLVRVVEAGENTFDFQLKSN